MVSRTVLINVGIILLIILAACGAIYFILGFPSRSPQDSLQDISQEVKQKSEQGIYEVKTFEPTIKVTPTMPVMKQSSSIMITNTRLLPGEVKIARGVDITFVNLGDQEVTIATDPVVTALRVGRLQVGDTVTVTFKDAGIFTFHNAQNPNMKATVIVE